MIDSYIINNKYIPCYNTTYDSDSNLYLRVSNINSSLCDHLNIIAIKIKDSQASLAEVVNGYKCFEKNQIIEFDINCISCNDQNVQEISIKLERSLTNLQALKEYTQQNHYDSNNLKELYSIAMENLVALQFSLHEIDNDIVKEIFDENFLFNTLIDNILKYATLGWYSNYSGNTIEHIITNLNTIQDGINYIDTHL